MQNNRVLKFFTVNVLNYMPQFIVPPAMIVTNILGRFLNSRPYLRRVSNGERNPRRGDSPRQGPGKNSSGVRSGRAQFRLLEHGHNLLDTKPFPFHSMPSFFPREGHYAGNSPSRWPEKRGADYRGRVCPTLFEVSTNSGEDHIRNTLYLRYAIPV